MPGVRFQDTPNPNAVKCLLDRRIAEKPRSYTGAAAAAGDPVASALFALGGVTHVLIHPEWVTVCKTPDTPWKPLRAAIERVLREAP
jgi:hypothetical protein